MKKNTKERNNLALILGGLAVLALIAFLVLSVAHVSNRVEGGIIGFCSTFGIDVAIGSSKVVISGVNAIGLVIIALILIAGVSTAYLSKFGYGWYYFSSIVLVAAIYFVFSYHATWIRLNCSQAIHGIGAGQIVSGSLLGIMFFGNFFAAYQQKNQY